MLETIDIETGPAPDAAIIWLHGLGADGHDFEPIVPELVAADGRGWRFVFPHAPIRAVTINNGMEMRAWYDIMGFERHSKEDVTGFWDSEARVHELIGREQARGVAASRIVLAGFSQGGAVCLYVAPRCKQPLAGVIALSCYLPRESTFDAERASANDATPIFMAHGQQDAVVPIGLGVASRDFLVKRGYPVEWRDYPMPHSLCAPEVQHIRDFLRRVLPEQH